MDCLNCLLSLQTTDDELLKNLFQDKYKEVPKRLHLCLEHKPETKHETYCDLLHFKSDEIKEMYDEGNYKGKLPLHVAILRNAPHAVVTMLLEKHPEALRVGISLEILILVECTTLYISYSFLLFH